jgi:hypothetical protein
MSSTGTIFYRPFLLTAYAGQCCESGSVIVRVTDPERVMDPHGSGSTTLVRTKDLVIFSSQNLVIVVVSPVPLVTEYSGSAQLC